MVNKKLLVILFNRYGESSSKLPLFSLVFGGKKVTFFFSWLTFLFLVPVFMFVLSFCCAFLVELLKFKHLKEEMLGQILSSVTWEKSQKNVLTLLR